MTLLLGLSLLANVALVAAFLRHGQARDDAFAAERRDWVRERSELLNRIKPEAAQPVADADAKPLPPVNLEDDDQYWQAAVEALEVETRTLVEARS